MTAHRIDPKIKNKCARRSAALACRRLIGSHTADVLVLEIEMILQEYEIMSKVTKIVTDGGSNFVCAFKDRPPIDPEECENTVEDSSSVRVLSLRELLSTYNGSVYGMRPHQ